MRLIERNTSNPPNYVIQCPYSERARVKAAGFRWDPLSKQWWTSQASVAAPFFEYAEEPTRSKLAAIAPPGDDYA